MKEGMTLYGRIHSILEEWSDLAILMSILGSVLDYSNTTIFCVHSIKPTRYECTIDPSNTFLFIVPLDITHIQIMQNQ